MIQTKKEDGTNKGYWKGKKRSQETKDKIRVSLKGRSVSPKTEFKKGNSGYWLGKKRDPEMVKRNAEKIRGIKYSTERLQKHKESVARGEKQTAWKGSSASYEAMHAWVRRYKGKPIFCSKCGKKEDGKSKFEWSNISGEYRRDLSDYESLCCHCHRKQDKRREVNSFRLSAFGETKTLIEWAEDSRCQVSHGCLVRRIKLYKYDPEKALTKPSIRS